MSSILTITYPSAHQHVQSIYSARACSKVHRVNCKTSDLAPRLPSHPSCNKAASLSMRRQDMCIPSMCARFKVSANSKNINRNRHLRSQQMVNLAETVSLPTSVKVKDIPNDASDKYDKNMLVHIITANVNGLRGKLGAIQVMIQAELPAVFACQETKIGKSVTSNTIEIANYRLFRKDRNEGGGGVAIYAHASLKPIQLTHGIDSNLELVAVKCKTSMEHFIVATTYRPPSYPVTDYVEKLSDFINSLGSANNQLILTGDLNICALKSEFKIMQDLCESVQMNQVIQTPTHKDRLIDHIYVNSLAKINSHGVSPPFEKHHMQTWAKICVSSAHQKSTTSPKWNFKRVDWQFINIKLMQRSISQEVQSAVSVHSAAEILQTHFQEVMRECIPKSTCKRRKSYEWITKTVIELYKEKSKSFRKWKQNRSAAHQANYKRLKKRLQKEMLVEKIKYFAQIFAECKNASSFWKNLNRLRGKCVQAGIPTLKLPNGQEADQDVSKAEALLGQFTSVFGVQNPHCSDPIPHHTDYKPLINPKIILHKISQLPGRKSPGIDGIPALVFKKCDLVLAPCLSIISERCLSEGAFPDAWKEAQVIPIPKVPEATNPSDYRPVSLLPIGSKLVETQLHAELLLYIEPRLSNVQFGFRSGRSTTDAIVLLQHYILKGFVLCEKVKRPANVVVIYFDIAKAFDTVPHDKLLQRLQEKFNIPLNALNMLKSYLTNRTMRVKVAEEMSACAPVTSGVPQGSVLGPLLFNSYINAVAELKDDDKISNWSSLILFADDLVYVHPVHADDARDVTHKDIVTINDCINSLALQLNVKKCKLQIMSLAPKGKSNLSVSLNGKPLENVSVYKYLGVDFDDRLSFGEHTTRVTNAVKKGIGALCRSLRKWAPVEVFNKAILTTTLPIFLYSIESWYPPHLKNQIRLERVLKYAIRLILNNFNHETSYEDLLKK
jgi:exonuclease III